MKLTIDDHIRSVAPGLALGVVSADVTVSARDAGLQRELKETIARLQAELASTQLPQLPQIKALRRLYHGLGKDPTRYRGSSEALLRRIIQGKGLYPINSAVDVCNLVSIQTRQALGAYDLDCVRGDIVFRPALAGEVYEGIGRGPINLEGLPVFCDAVGPFGSPTIDSERTMITLTSQWIALIIISCTGREQLPEHLARAGGLLRQYAAAANVTTVICT